MAHLTNVVRRRGRRCALLLLPVASWLGACDTGDVTTRVVTTVFELPVRCAADGTCVTEETNLPVTGERFDVAGVLSSGASQYDPGLYLYAGGFRASGIFYELELDIPAYVGEESREIVASYREYLAGRPFFTSARVGGTIQLVSLSGNDGPYAGVFDLTFIDPGRDAAFETTDDDVRTLRFGSFTLSGHEPENPTRPDYTWGDQVWVDVDADVVIYDPAYDYDPAGCGGDTAEGYGEGSGCEGDTSTDPGGGAGCEGDTTGDVGGGSGCEGDTSGDLGGGEGCSGDTSGDSGGGGGCSGDSGGTSSGCGGSNGGGGCTGDVAGSSATVRAPTRSRPNRYLSASLPLLALLVTRGILRRR